MQQPHCGIPGRLSDEFRPCRSLMVVEAEEEEGEAVVVEEAGLKQPVLSLHRRHTRSTTRRQLPQR